MCQSNGKKLRRSNMAQQSYSFSLLISYLISGLIRQNFDVLLPSSVLFFLFLYLRHVWCTLIAVINNPPRWKKDKMEKPERLKQPVHFGLRHIKSKIAKKSSQTQRVLMSVYWLCSLFSLSILFFFICLTRQHVSLLYCWLHISFALCNFSRNFIRIIFDYVRS